MREITIHHYIILSSLLFCLGFVGIILRRNLLVVLMCLEVLMNAIILAFVAFARYYNEHDGHVMAMIIMAIAAVEAAIGLGIVVTIFHHRKSIDTNDLKSMKG
ncbi:MAG TPA: NADH-quinone oxidoreductase subunit NuoK [bacterium]|nr:NADH-quinone oxidoreductase subunit NuoK [bacterium]